MTWKLIPPTGESESERLPTAGSSGSFVVGTAIGLFELTGTSLFSGVASAAAAVVDCLFLFAIAIGIRAGNWADSSMGWWWMLVA